jgi:hypothetical protein
MVVDDDIARLADYQDAAGAQRTSSQRTRRHYGSPSYSKESSDTATTAGPGSNGQARIGLAIAQGSPSTGLGN